MTADGGACVICLDTSPPPIQMGCACCGDAALAHIDCMVQTIAALRAQRGFMVWRQCQTCKQHFTGPMRTGLADAWRSRVADQAAESDERLAAERNLTKALRSEGNDATAIPLLR